MRTRASIEMAAFAKTKLWKIIYLKRRDAGHLAVYLAYISDSITLGAELRDLKRFRGRLKTPFFFFKQKKKKLSLRDFFNFFNITSKKFFFSKTKLFDTISINKSTEHILNMLSEWAFYTNLLQIFLFCFYFELQIIQKREIGS